MLTTLLMAALAWLAWRYRKKLPRYTFAGQRWTLLQLMNLTPQEFERFVAQVYRELGYRVRDNPYRAADGGVDLLLERGGQRVAVQCKRWQGTVPVQPVRELWGVKHAIAADGAVFVTTGQFTTAATAWAKPLRGLELVDGDRLLRTVRHLSSAPPPPR